MSKRFGKKRVPECECTTRFTCRPCLIASICYASAPVVYRNLMLRLKGKS